MAKEAQARTSTQRPPPSGDVVDPGWHTDEATPLEEYPRTPMTGWYDPRMMAATAIDIATSSLLGVRGDFRLLEALSAPQGVFDYSRDEEAERTELWVDYVSDPGDGWNPTYAVASLLARPTLALGGATTRRGDVLIMGGDEVYPSASRDLYQKRLVRPYRSALRLQPGEKAPDLFAVPGNHDWYDGLICFMRLFAQGRSIGAWRTRQTRSYFALKLPHGFWFFGTDFQLESDIDRPQLEYFIEVVKQAQPGDCIVLATAEPVWVNARSHADPLMQKHLAYFEARLKKANPGAQIVVRLAGDLHHYRRHASRSGAQNFTSGGGGAFLHPTHGESVAVVQSGPLGKEEDYSLKCAFPSVEESRKMTWKNLLFIRHNGWFSLVTGFAYGLLSLSFTRPGPSALFWIVMILLVFVAFTDTHKRWYKWFGGITHGLSHLTTALLCAHAANSLVEREKAHFLGGLPEVWSDLAQEFLTMLGAGIGGAIFGPLLMGLYLWGSLNVLKRHGNEAFSALRIQDWKNFLRLHVEKDKLTLYPVGLRTVPRKWKLQEGAPPGQPLFVPGEGEALTPILIEEPVVIPRP